LHGVFSILAADFPADPSERAGRVAAHKRAG